jgi:hypothetical protein
MAGLGGKAYQIDETGSCFSTYTVFPVKPNNNWLLKRHVEVGNSPLRECKNPILLARNGVYI